MRAPDPRLGSVAFDWAPEWHVTWRIKRFNTITEIRLTHSGWGARKTAREGDPQGVSHAALERHWERVIMERLPRILGAKATTRG